MSFPQTVAKTSGSGTETVPTGATSCRIRLVGAGGRGGQGDGSTSGAGGGGGGAREYTVDVSGGETFSYSVGATTASVGQNSTVTGNVTGDASVSMTGNGGFNASGFTPGIGGSSSGDGSGTSGQDGFAGGTHGDGGGEVAGWANFADKGRGGNGSAFIAPNGTAGYIEFYYDGPTEVDLGTPDAVASATAVEAPSLEQSTALTPAAIASVSEISSPVIGQNHSLTPTLIDSAASVASVLLSQNHALASPDALISATSIAEPAFSQAVGLDVGEISLTPSVDSVGIGQDHVLAPAALLCTPAVGSPIVGEEFPPWPSELPQFFDQQGYGESAPDNRLDTPTDYGPGKTRPRYTNAWRAIGGNIRCSAAQVAIFEDFYYEDLDGGRIDFSWVNPITQTAARFRFVKPDPVVTYIDADQYTIHLRLSQVA